MPVIKETMLVKISLTMLLSMGAGLIAGVSYTVGVSKDTQANTKAIERVEAKQDKYLETVQSIDTRLSNIEGRLNIGPAKK